MAVCWLSCSVSPFLETRPEGRRHRLAPSSIVTPYALDALQRHLECSCDGSRQDQVGYFERTCLFVYICLRLEVSGFGRDRFGSDSRPVRLCCCCCCCGLDAEVGRVLEHCSRFRGKIIGGCVLILVQPTRAH